MDISSLSHAAKTVLLSRIAHELTVSARSTYEVGTDRVLKPELLRAYNELLHRVTSSVRSHVENKDGMPLEAVLEMMRDYGVGLGITSEMDWVLKMAQERPLP